MAAGSPREVESPTPAAEGRKGDRGASACGGRGDARRRAFSRGGHVHRRGADERNGGIGGRRGGRS
jgi:hypothetical protein